MATKADEFEPDSPIVEQAIRVALQPRMQAFEAERGFSMTARLTVWTRDECGSNWLIDSTAINPPAIEPKGEIRLRFRRTFRADRVLFRAESVFPGLDTGFTGFAVAGHLILNSRDVVVHTRSWVGQYNILAWNGWD